MSELKPFAYAVFQEGVGERLRSTESLIDQWFEIENAQEYYGDGMIPLYAIPEGYHIVAIDPEQELRDNLERHNEGVKLRKLALIL